MSLIEKKKEKKCNDVYQTPMSKVIELKCEGHIMSGSLLDLEGNGGPWGTTDTNTSESARNSFLN